LAAILSQARSRLERLGPVRLEETNEGNLDATMDALFQLRGVEDAVFQSFHREVARGLLAARALRLYALLVNERPVAVFHGFQDGAHVRYHLGGVDPDFERYHVGHLVIAHALEEAARSGATVFDFPRGPEPSRYLWGVRESRGYRRSVWHGPETKM
jgi:CelD/BcsL family acetyltransferase involved in cellulose biosynthesis